MVDELPRRSRAEAGEQTRLALLAAGADLLREQPVGRILDQVTAPEVARRAGRTIGAFYHHWTDQDAYRRDLLNWVLVHPAIPVAAALAEVSRALTDGTPAESLVRWSTRLGLQIALDRPEFALTVALSALARRDERTRELLGLHYARIDEAVVPVVETLLASQGWAPRPPFDVRALAMVFTALAEGLVLRAVADPGAVPQDLPDETGAPEDDAWGLLGVTVFALLPMLTMPVGPPEAGVDVPQVDGPQVDVREKVRAMWAAR